MKMANLPILLDLADNLFQPMYDPDLFYVRHPMRLWPGDRHLTRNRKSCMKNEMSKIGKDGFQVCMDVQQFKPSELNVKVVEDCVIIEGKHEEREDDHGFISRQFTRRYKLPKGYDPNKVVSTLSSDGVLSINVPKPQSENKANERIIQIQQVGPAHLNVKDNKNEEKSEEKE